MEAVFYPTGDLKILHDFYSNGRFGVGAGWFKIQSSDGDVVFHMVFAEQFEKLSIVFAHLADKARAFEARERNRLDLLTLDNKGG